jgi:hypothetical protein
MATLLGDFFCVILIGQNLIRHSTTMYNGRKGVG